MSRFFEACSLRRLGRRHVVAAVAWLILVTQGASFAHLLLVRHAVCPEHGELIHPDEVGTAAHVAPASTPGNGSAAIGAADDASHEHGHCTVAVHRRHAISVPPARFIALLARPPVEAVQPPVSAARPAAIAIYRLAPKNSPPA